jgi:hypothetical protein
LKEAASQANVAADLLKIKGIESGLLTAAGLSDKSLTYLTAKDKKDFLKLDTHLILSSLALRFRRKWQVKSGVN